MQVHADNGQLFEITLKRGRSQYATRWWSGRTNADLLWSTILAYSGQPPTEVELREEPFFLRHINRMGTMKQHQEELAPFTFQAFVRVQCVCGWSESASYRGDAEQAAMLHRETCQEIARFKQAAGT